MKNFVVPAVLVVLVLSSCSTLKSWFTAQGQKVAQGKDLEAQGNPLAASALAAEALVLEPQYNEARDLLVQTFAPGQGEFRSESSRLTTSNNPSKWDELVSLYRWQDRLATAVPALGPILDPATGLALDLKVAPVKDTLTTATLGAAGYHLDRAQGLLAAAPGPRQARLALAEGRLAAGYNPGAPGLQEWLDRAEAAASQKLMVIPFFWEARWRLPAASGELGSQISRRLLEEPGLPELTTVFSSDRLVTLPGGGAARIGLVSQPDALTLAAVAGQNLVLMGQVSRAVYTDPRSTATSVNRVRQVVSVDPSHPEGVTLVYKAVVTSTETVSEVDLSASFTVIEADTGRDLLTAVRDARAQGRAVTTTFTGDAEALTDDDRMALASKAVLPGPDDLKTSAVEVLAEDVAAVVREALR